MASKPSLALGGSYAIIAFLMGELFIGFLMLILIWGFYDVQVAIEND